MQVEVQQRPVRAEEQPLGPHRLHGLGDRLGRLPAGVGVELLVPLHQLEDHLRLVAVHVRQADRHLGEGLEQRLIARGIRRPHVLVAHRGEGTGVNDHEALAGLSHLEERAVDRVVRRVPVHVRVDLEALGPIGHQRLEAVDPGALVRVSLHLRQHRHRDQGLRRRPGRLQHPGVARRRLTSDEHRALDAVLLHGGQQLLQGAQQQHRGRGNGGEPGLQGLVHPGRALLALLGQLLDPHRAALAGAGQVAHRPGQGALGQVQQRGHALLEGGVQRGGQPLHRPRELLAGLGIRVCVTVDHGCSLAARATSVSWDRRPPCRGFPPCRPA